MLFTLQILAVACAGLFAGAAIYVNAVEHLARVSCGAAVALRQFAPSYRRGTVMQASLAVVGLVTAVAAWWMGGHLWILLGELLLGAVVPFTLLGIFPTNHRLLAPGLDPHGPEAMALLRRWGRLHAVRSVLGMLDFGLLVVGLASRDVGGRRRGILRGTAIGMTMRFARVQWPLDGMFSRMLGV